MKIIYLGAEVGSNRKILESMGSKSVGVSFWRAVKRGLPTTKAYELKNYFPDYMEIHAHAGVPTHLNLTQEELEDFAASYEDFVATNIDRLASFTEFDHPLLSQSFIEDQRRLVWNGVPEGKFRPVWHAVTGAEGLRKLAENYLDVGITGEDIEAVTQLAALTTELRNTHGTRFHAISCGKPDNLRQIKFETASTMSWLSPMINGETIIWDGTSINRYPKKMKDQARTRWVRVYEEAGLDADKILEDDNKEVCRLAIWSFDQLESRLNMGHQDNGDFDELYDKKTGWITPDDMEPTLAVPDNKGGKVRKFEPRNQDEIVPLPVFGFDIQTEVEADGTIRDVTVVQSTSQSLRVCDTCFVASKCPAFKESSTCAFKLPIEVKTKDQLKSLINAIIEMQGQRVAFMRFTEELNGGYADPNVSQEIDRLLKLVKTTKEIDDSREFIRMTAEVRGGSGALSRIFGSKAEQLKELPEGGFSQDQTTRIIQQSLEE